MLLIGAAAAVTVGVSAARSPYGAYDAWAIWNTHARFISRGGAHWRDLLLPGSSAHPDYPLLLPGAVARGWLLVGAETPLVPIVISAGFALATAGMLLASLAILGGQRRAAAGLAFLLGTSQFVYHGAAQTADVPLGAYVLAALALHALWSRGPDAPGPALLMGLAAALAGWTKNEGLLFLLVFSGVVAVVQFVHHGSSMPQVFTTKARSHEGGTSASQSASCLRAFVVQLVGAVRRRGIVCYPALARLAPYIAGALPVAALVVYFKLALAPPNDLVAGQGGAMPARLLSPARAAEIARAYLFWLATFGRGVLAALAGYLLVTRGLPRPSAAATVALLMLLGYAGVFLVTPHDLTWHLAALERLLLQLWPAILLACLLPDDARER